MSNKLSYVAFMQVAEGKISATSMVP